MNDNLENGKPSESRNCYGSGEVHLPRAIAMLRRYLWLVFPVACLLIVTVLLVMFLKRQDRNNDEIGAQNSVAHRSGITEERTSQEAGYHPSDSQPQKEKPPDSDASTQSPRRKTGTQNAFIPIGNEGIMKLANASFRELSSMLAMRQHWNYWESIAQTLGNAGIGTKDSVAAQALIDYMSRNDDGGPQSEDTVTGKVYAPLALGKIGGEEANRMLQRCIERDGAEQFLAGWINTQAVGYFHGDRASLLATFRGNCAQGLVFTGEESNIRLVEQTLEALDAELAANPHYSTPLGSTQDTRTREDKVQEVFYVAVVRALVSRDAIEQMGLKKYTTLSLQEQAQVVNLNRPKYDALYEFMYPPKAE